MKTFSELLFYNHIDRKFTFTHVNEDAMELALPHGLSISH